MKTPLRQCPLCGKKKMGKDTDDIIFERVRGVKGDVVVFNVTFFYCNGCDEKLYDHVALTKIEAAIAEAKALRPDL